MFDIIFWTLYIVLGCATVVWTAALDYLDLDDISDFFIALGLIFVWPFALGFAVVILGISGLIVLGRKIGNLK
jgi:hypothetical protein